MKRSPYIGFQFFDRACLHQPAIHITDKANFVSVQPFADREQDASDILEISHAVIRHILPAPQPLQQADPVLVCLPVSHGPVREFRQTELAFTQEFFCPADGFFDVRSFITIPFLSQYNVFGLFC